MAIIGRTITFMEAPFVRPNNQATQPDHAGRTLKSEEPSFGWPVCCGALADPNLPSVGAIRSRLKRSGAPRAGGEFPGAEPQPHVLKGRAEMGTQINGGFPFFFPLIRYGIRETLARNGVSRSAFPPWRPATVGLTKTLLSFLPFFRGHFPDHAWTGCGLGVTGADCGFSRASRS